MKVFLSPRLIIEVLLQADYLSIITKLYARKDSPNMKGNIARKDLWQFDKKGFQSIVAVDISRRLIKQVAIKKHFAQLTF